MRRTATLILIAVCGAVLLLIAAAGNASKPEHFGMATSAQATGGFAALIALTVFAAAIAEYLIHGRKIFLCVAAGFFAAGLVDAWCALLPASSVASGLALWYAGRLTLAALLLYGALAARTHTPRRTTKLRAVVYLTGVVLWVAVVLFSVSEFSVDKLLAGGDAARNTALVSVVLFALAWFAYSRPAVQRNSTLLAWISYGLIFGVFAQLSAVLSHTGKYAADTGMLSGLANMMKLLSYITPVAGLVAEHARLRGCIEGQSAELRTLGDLQDAIISTTSPSKLYQQIVEIIAAFFKFDAVCLMPYDRTRNLVYVAASTGFDEETKKSLVFRSGDGPVGEAVSTRETKYVADAGGNDSLSLKLGEVGTRRSAVAVPLLVTTEFGESVVGVLMAVFKRVPGSRKQKDRLHLLDVFASQTALAVERVQKGMRMNESTTEYEARVHELETVSKIGEAITSEIQLDSLVDRLGAELKNVLMAETCSVLIFDREAGRMRILGYKRPSREHFVAEHVDQCDQAALLVADSGQLRVLNDVPNCCHCKYPELMGENEGVHHLLSVPMLLRGRNVGAINVFRSNGEPWGESDIRLLEMLSKFVAAGVRNAQQYEREQNIAKCLQDSIMSSIDRDFPGMEINAYYHVDPEVSAVGGDFFDVLDLGEGRYGVAIGDVAGKGPDAAVYMGMAKHMIKAYANDDPDPVAVVTKLNSALNTHIPTNRFITLVYGLLDSGKGEFTYVNAGHELPFHYREEDEKLICLESTGVAAGAVPEAEYESQTLAFKNGDILVFYTDGATEARGDQGLLNTEGVYEIVKRQIRLSSRNLSEAVFTSVRNYAGDRLTDDVAILCIKSVVPPPGKLF